MKYVCTVCGFTYDEAAGMPEKGIAPGTRWEELPEDWRCPWCGAAKGDFRAEKAPEPIPAPAEGPEAGEELRPMGRAELSALLSNLARGCEKQYREEEAALYAKLAEHFRPAPSQEGLEGLIRGLEEELEGAYPRAVAAARGAADRGALRALVWSEKTSRMLLSIARRYEKEGGAFLEKTSVYVCDICGFIYVGDRPPEICPVCKVPSFKLLKVQRG